LKKQEMTSPSKTIRKVFREKGKKGKGHGKTERKTPQKVERGENRGTLAQKALLEVGLAQRQWKCNMRGGLQERNIIYVRRLTSNIEGS